VAKFNQDLHQFGSAKPANAGGSQHCAQCEAMLTDALDGTLSKEEQAQFDLHMAGCVSCSQMLADAQRGAAWLEMLRFPRPEPPAALLERILAQTSPATALPQNHLSILPAPVSSHSELASFAGGDGITPAHTTTILPFRSRIAAAFRSKSLSQTMLQPRLAMTAAMAFFSIGLTLNLTGVRLNELHVSDLKPSSLRRTFYQANAYFARSYDNLKVVYELESRVRDLQHADDNDGVTPPKPSSSNQAPVTTTPKPGQLDQPDQKQSRPHPGPGTSREQSPFEGTMKLAALHLPGASVSPPSSLVCALSTEERATSSNLQKGELV
jgi:Putative zinc-finger